MIDISGERLPFHFINDPISGRVDRASATETVDLGSIPSPVKPKSVKIGIYSFLLNVLY